MPIDVVRELEKVRKHIENVELHLQVLSAMRFLDCVKGGGPIDECFGIYRLTPKPPPPIRAALKSVLGKADYAALSKVWKSNGRM